MGPVVDAVDVGEGDVVDGSCRDRDAHVVSLHGQVGHVDVARGDGQARRRSCAAPSSTSGLVGSVAVDRDVGLVDDRLLRICAGVDVDGVARLGDLDTRGPGRGGPPVDAAAELAGVGEGVAAGGVRERAQVTRAPLLHPHEAGEGVVVAAACPVELGSRRSRRSRGC